MDAPQLVTFMSDGVAARIDSPDFWVGLDRLRTEYGMDTPHLVNFISNNVAARLHCGDVLLGGVSSHADGHVCVLFLPGTDDTSATA